MSLCRRISKLHERDRQEPQGYGVRRRSEPISKPTARELFTTDFSRLTAEPASVLPAFATNSSPAPQEPGSGGELIGPSTHQQASPRESFALPQAVDGMVVAAIEPGSPVSIRSSPPGGIIHQRGHQAGEQSAEGPPRGLRHRPSSLLGQTAHGVCLLLRPAAL
jgi:hypothetical protein